MDPAPAVGSAHEALGAQSDTACLVGGEFQDGRRQGRHASTLERATDTRGRPVGTGAGQPQIGGEQ